MFILNGNEAVPLYKQLYHQLREQALSGRLGADAKLPSVRELAAELAVSRNTVEGAYQELYAEGYIYSRPRRGYFVAALDRDAAPHPLPRRQPKQEPLPEPQAEPAYDFHPARLDRDSFPATLWRKCFLDSLRESSRQLAHYADPQGERVLRSNIRAYLAHARGVICEPEQIVICSGLQQSLGIVARILRETHRSVAVERPGYHLPRAVFRNHGYRVIDVAVGSHGLDLDALDACAGTIAYVTPSHQLPLGHVMPVANRLRLIDWAESAGRFIIEDDYDSELRYRGKPIPSLQGLRPGGNIVYLGTFSKILSPGLRVSYLVLPESLVDDYRRIFRDYCPTVSLLEQLTLAKFMARGHWERHVRRMRTLYGKKHDGLLAAVARHFGPRAQVVGAGAGLHIVLQLSARGEDEAEIIRRARQEGIRLFPFSETCAGAEAGPLRLMLGFGGPSAGELDAALALLARVCGTIGKDRPRG